jgi:hypothetical protein
MNLIDNSLMFNFAPGLIRSRASDRAGWIATFIFWALVFTGLILFAQTAFADPSKPSPPVDASAPSASFTPTSVPTINLERDSLEVCKKYEHQKAYDSGAGPVMISCELARQQYESIVRYLKNTNKPVFANFDEMLRRIEERSFETVFRKKDTESCTPLKDQNEIQKTPKSTKALSCVMGDMNLTFFLNDKDQIIKTRVEIGIGARIYQSVYDQYFGKFKHPGATLNYNLMVAEFFARASVLVDGRYVNTAFKNNGFVITFLNPSFN